MLAAKSLFLGDNCVIKILFFKALLLYLIFMAAVENAHPIDVVLVYPAPETYTWIGSIGGG